MWPKTTVLILLLALFVATPVLASETNGVIDPLYKYAWGENLGWLNCAPTSASSVYNGLNITASEIIGYAWSSVGGWINFAPPGGGVTNDSTGTLGGYAWSSQKGWINMAGVTINTATGKFSGTGGTLGTAAGRINFSCDNCDVRTDWRSTPTCTSWTYSSWSSCSNSQQTRSILSASPANCSGGSPVLSKNCQSGGGGLLVTPVTTPESTVDAPSTVATTSEVDINSAAYERWFTEIVKRTDIVRDGIIDIFDFNDLMVNWGRTGSNIAADTNQDSVVDIFDFNAVMVYWGQVEFKI